jgi:hypothetical protein
MNSMKQSSEGRTGRILLRVLVAFAFLTPLQSFSASEPDGGVQPSVVAPATASEDDRATKKIPKKLLRPLLGCWQLDGQERWTISRLDANGAQVVTKLMKRPGHASFPGYAKRAAVPSTLMYDARQGNFGFSTAGGGRATLVLFNQSDSTLKASLFTKRSSKDHFASTGSTATLQRCKAPTRTRSPHARPSPTPPRLK